MTTPHRPHEKPKGADRRTWSRLPAEELPNVRVALKSGLAVELINVSRGGAQFRTANRLLPGLGVTLRLITSDGELHVPGRVVRSSMVRLQSGSLGYEVGVSFELLLPGTPARASRPAEAVEPEPGEPIPFGEPAGPIGESAPAEPMADEDIVALDDEMLADEPAAPGDRRREPPATVTAELTNQSLEGLIELLETE